MLLAPAGPTRSSSRLGSRAPPEARCLPPAGARSAASLAWEAVLPRVLGGVWDHTVLSLALSSNSCAEPWPPLSPRPRMSVKCPERPQEGSICCHLLMVQFQWHMFCRPQHLMSGDTCGLRPAIGSLGSSSNHRQAPPLKLKLPSGVT